MQAINKLPLPIPNSPDYALPKPNVHQTLWNHLGPVSECPYQREDFVQAPENTVEYFIQDAIWRNINNPQSMGNMTQPLPFYMAMQEFWDCPVRKQIAQDYIIDGKWKQELADNPGVELTEEDLALYVLSATYFKITRGGGEGHWMGDDYRSYVGVYPEPLDILRAAIAYYDHHRKAMQKAENVVKKGRPRKTQEQIEAEERAKQNRRSKNDAYIEACQLRKLNITMAKDKVRDAVEQKRAIVHEWDMYIKSLRAEVKTLEAVPVPQRDDF